MHSISNDYRLNSSEFKKIWKCRPGAKSNKECTEEERKNAKKWIIGGTVAVGAAAATAIGAGAHRKVGEKRRVVRSEVRKTLPSWSELFAHGLLKKIQRMLNSIQKTPLVSEGLQLAEQIDKEAHDHNSLKPSMLGKMAGEWNTYKTPALESITKKYSRILNILKQLYAEKQLSSHEDDYNYILEKSGFRRSIVPGQLGVLFPDEDN